MKINTILKTLYIEIISECNQRCIYCYNEDIISKREILPLSLLKEVIGTAKEIGMEGVTFSGGEPLLFPEFKDLLGYCNDNEVNVSVISNVTLMNEYFAEIFAQYNPNLQITIDSGMEDLHEKSRGKNTYNRQEQAIRMLRTAGYNGEINIRCNLWQGNCTKENIISVLNFAKRNNVKTLKFALVHNTDFFKKTINEESQKELISSWVNAEKENFADIDFSFPEEAPEFGCPLLSEKSDVDCGFRIAPDGNVFPCQLFFDSQYALGNIYKRSIGKIVDGKELQRFLTLMQLRRHYIAECQPCVCQSVCIGGCPAKAFLDTGNIFAPDGPCSIRKKAYNDILKKALSVADNN